MKKSYYILSLLCVILLALNLRAPITVVGSLAHEISQLWQLAPSSFGALGSVPLFCFFIFSLLAPFAARTKAMSLALIAIVIGELIRSGINSLSLFAGTVFIGAGIAVLNVMMPSFIKRNFKNIAKTMAIYSLCLSLSSLIGVFGHYLSGILNTRMILAIWIILAISAGLCFYPFVKNKRFKRGQSKMSIKGFKQVFCLRSAWIITAFMGLQSCVFYTVINWLLIILKDRLHNVTTGANLVVLFQTSAVFSAFFVPMLMAKAQQAAICKILSPAKLLHLVCACNVIAFLILLSGSGSLMLLSLAAMLFSIPVGGVFGVALAMIATKASNAQTTIYLSAMAQSIGYLIAAFGPWIFGALSEINSQISYFYPIVFMIIISISLWVSAIFSNKISKI